MQVSARNMMSRDFRAKKSRASLAEASDMMEFSCKDKEEEEEGGS